MTQQLAVVGAGLMGSGIAQVAAVAGWQVVLRDVTDEALQRGRDGIETSRDPGPARDETPVTFAEKGP